jgi:uncharacterized protein (TIGR02246 family)
MSVQSDVFLECSMHTKLAMLLPLMAAATVAIQPVRAAEPGSTARVASKSKDEEAIRGAAAAYRQALAKRDIAAIAAFWTPDADYVDQLGRVYNIQAGLAQAKQQSQEERHIAHLSPKMETLSIRSLTPDVAIEDGAFERAGAAAGQAPHGRYTAVWVNRNGKWLIDGMRESPDRADINSEPLKGLAWMIGDWVAESPQLAAEVSSAWGANKAYIIAHLKMEPKGAKPITATQLIGWDPIQQRVRSYMFDSRGAFTEGVWTNEGDAWVVATTGVLPDGKRLSATKVYSRVDDDTAIWESIDDEVNGQPSLDVRLRVTRKKAKK